MQADFLDYDVICVLTSKHKQSLRKGGHIYKEIHLH